MTIKTEGAIHETITGEESRTSDGQRDTPTGHDFRVDQALPLPETIRKYCRYCVGDEIAEIPVCTATPEDCQLWPWRMGVGPADRSRGHTARSRLKAIGAECKYCMGGNAAWARECDTSHCPLWPWRTGHYPKGYKGRSNNPKGNPEALRKHQKSALLNAKATQDGQKAPSEGVKYCPPLSRGILRPELPQEARTTDWKTQRGTHWTS